MGTHDKKIKSVGFYVRPGNDAASAWAEKISRWIEKEHPEVALGVPHPEVLIALGGDGTILEAARICGEAGATILGLNLGTVGFLSSTRREADFLMDLAKLFKGEFVLTEHIMVTAKVRRGGKEVFSAEALNEVAVLNPLGMMDLEVFVDDYPFERIRGTGVIVATPIGSTAYNLSAHGPAVMPDLHAMILTKVLDHSIPTPSVVLKDDRKIDLKIEHFRERHLLMTESSKESVEVVLAADGEVIFPLLKGDVVTVTRSPRTVKLVRFDSNYFIKSLKEQFFFD